MAVLIVRRLVSIVNNVLVPLQWPGLRFEIHEDQCVLLVSAESPSDYDRSVYLQRCEGLSGSSTAVDSGIKRAKKRLT